MDIDHKIQLGSEKNINSVDEDAYTKLVLDSTKKEIAENDVKSVIDVTELYDTERQNTLIYRIYGGIEYLSLLNGLISNYTELSNFFSPELPDQTGTNVKTLLNSFNIYLLKPSIETYPSISGDEYRRKFDVISELSNIEIFKAGYSRSLFDQQKYIYDFNIDIDLTNMYDYFMFPITDVYLYFVYKPSTNGNGVAETIQTRLGDGSWSNFTTTTYNLGDVVDGDAVLYDLENFTQTISRDRNFKITTQYTDISSKELEWVYNPLIKLNLRAFEDDLRTANVNDTSYEVTDKIPIYATEIDSDGNYVWRNILDVGFIDPITDSGVSYPFVNKRHYIFNNIILDIKPNLDHTNTSTVFNEIKLAEDTSIDNKPISDINNFGAPC